MTSEEFTKRIVPMMQTMYRVSYSLLRSSSDRDDAVQEALRKAWQKRDRLRDESCLKGWVLRILINECKNILGKGRREIYMDELPERAAPPDADAALHDALLELPEKLRLPVVLHYLEGYSVGEVAQLLRLPLGTVKTRMAKARTTLRQMLSEEVPM